VAKILTEAQVQAFRRDGFLSPVRAMSAERARQYRERFESLEARVPDIKKMKTKSHLLCPWVLEIAEDPYILDVFEDLVGPNLRCWSMAWRVKKADGETFAGWHQDSYYGSAVPVVLGALAPTTTSTTSPGPTASTPRPPWRTGDASSVRAPGCSSKTAATARARRTAGRARPRKPRAARLDW